jgi:hypothetical protein
MKTFPSVLASVASTAIGFGAHWVLLSWAERSFPAISAKKRPILAACGVIAVTPALSRVLEMRTHSPIVDVVFATSLVEQMIVILAALPLLVLIGLSELARGKRGRRAEASAVAEGAVTRRRAIETVGGTAVLGATGFAFGWGMTIGRHGYVVREVPVRIPGLPKELDGYVIAQISDVHAGLFVGERASFEKGPSSFATSAPTSSSRRAIWSTTTRSTRDRSRASSPTSRRATGSSPSSGTTTTMPGTRGSPRPCAPRASRSS